MKRILALAVLASSVLFAGCASNLTGHDYSAVSTRQVMTVEEGVVDSVRDVHIQPMPQNSNGIGSLAGAALGAVLGGGHGGGVGSLALGIVGAVAGGIAGQIAEHKARETDGVEITIRLNDTGKLVAVTQAADRSEPFVKGDKVRLLSTSMGVARVAHV